MSQSWEGVGNVLVSSVCAHLPLRSDSSLNQHLSLLDHERLISTLFPQLSFTEVRKRYGSVLYGANVPCVQLNYFLRYLHKASMRTIWNTGAYKSDLFT